MKLAALLVACVFALGVLWLAGEQHRENCIAAGKTGCSVLPWDSGDPHDVRGHRLRGGGGARHDGRARLRAHRARHDGLALVERLAALGVPAESVILAHLDRNPDAHEHAETAATGAWLQFDGPGRTKHHPDSTILQLIADLADAGFAGKMLLGGDTGRAGMMRAYGGGPGLDYLFARFKPRLEGELGDELSSTLFRANPARAFAFKPRDESPQPDARVAAGSESGRPRRREAQQLARRLDPRSDNEHDSL